MKDIPPLFSFLMMTETVKPLVKAKGFKKDIASAQWLVEESVQSINRFARELDSHQQA